MALLRAGMPFTTICFAGGVSERLPKDGKDLKVVQTGGPRAKKRTVAAIQHTVAEMRKDLRKSIWKLAAEEIAVDSMKRFTDEDLGMHSMVIPEKPVLAINDRKKTAQKGQTDAQDFGKVLIFSDENSLSPMLWSTATIVDIFQTYQCPRSMRRSGSAPSLRRWRRSCLGHSQRWQKESDRFCA